MKSCTGRGRGAGVCTREEAEATRVSGPGPGLTAPAGSPCFLPPATRCSWRARCGGKAWGSSSYRFCSSWPTGRAVCVCVCVCVCVALWRSCLCCMPGKGGGDKAHRNVLEEGYLEPPCPAVTPHLAQWAQGSKHPQVPVLCVSTGTWRRSQSGGEQPCLRVAVRLPSGAQEHSPEQTGDGRRRQERTRVI